MINRSAVRVYAGIGLMTAAMLLASAPPARAQFQPKRVSNPASGEAYHVELSGGLWFPTADITISDTALNQIGTDVNLKTDLGLVDKRFPVFDAVIRPARKHKFRVQFIPIEYTQTATLTRTIVFNGRTYTPSVPVTSTLDWKAYRFGYEYDFVSADAGFFGVIVEAKYTQIDASLSSPLVSGASSVKTPIPAIGGIARIYLTSSLSVTGELTGIKIPATNNRKGHYADFDTYGTLNFTNHLGLLGGYRSFDVQYLIEEDAGSMTLKGWYAALAIRF